MTFYDHGTPQCWDLEIQPNSAQWDGLYAEFPPGPSIVAAVHSILEGFKTLVDQSMAISGT